MVRMREQDKPREAPRAKDEGDMTVREAGRLGGHKGGQRVKELVAEGKRAEEAQGGPEEEG